MQRAIGKLRALIDFFIIFQNAEKDKNGEALLYEDNKKGNAKWITAERCEWDLPDFEEEKFTVIDELLIQAPDEFGMDDAVTEKYLEKHPELKAWMEEEK